jgi:hypothetical protein
VEDASAPPGGMTHHFVDSSGRNMAHFHASFKIDHARESSRHARTFMLQKKLLLFPIRVLLTVANFVAFGVIAAKLLQIELIWAQILWYSLRLKICVLLLSTYGCM